MVGAFRRRPGTFMPKKILLIENDAATAADLARALEARGVETRVTGDGKEGLELARDERPDAIVLCVELPKMSGYSVCQKLRKDEGLKGIPLLLTSAEATEETFEAHRKLKARADAYLLKPFTAAALLGKLDELVALPQAPAAEELVTLDDVEELSGEIPLIPPGERVRRSDALPDQDEDLKLLDDAFDQISAEPPATPAEPPARPLRATPPPAPPPAFEPSLADEQPMAREELRAASELLPAGDEASAHAEIDRLGEEADAALAALGADESAGPELLLDEPPVAPRPAGPETPRAAAIPIPGAEPPATAGPAAGGLLAEKDAEIRRLEDRVAQLLIDLGRARDGAGAEHRPQADQELAAARAEARREADARRQAEDRARRAEEAQRRADETRQQAEEGQQAAEEAVRRGEADARAVAEALHEAEEAQRAAEEGRGAAEAALREAAEQVRKVGERAGMLEAEVASLRLRVEESEQTASLKAAQLDEAVAHHGALGEQITALTAQLTLAEGARGEAESLRAELEAARGAVEERRAEAERRAGEQARRIADLEAVVAKHEERVVKAYQKIKGDEKIREKTRKALAIALQLLDERIAAAPAKEPGDPVPRRE